MLFRLVHGYQEERLFWHFSPKGSYFVKSGYKIGWDSHEKKKDGEAFLFFLLPSDVWKAIRNLKVHPKIKHFGGGLVEI